MQNRIVYEDGEDWNGVLGNRSLAAGDNVGAAQIELALSRLQFVVTRNEAWNQQKINRCNSGTVTYDWACFIVVINVHVVEYKPLLCCCCCYGGGCIHTYQTIGQSRIGQNTVSGIQIKLLAKQNYHFCTR